MLNTGVDFNLKVFNLFPKQGPGSLGQLLWHQEIGLFDDLGLKIERLQSLGSFNSKKPSADYCGRGFARRELDDFAIGLLAE